MLLAPEQLRLDACELNNVDGRTREIGMEVSD